MNNTQALGTGVSKAGELSLTKIWLYDTQRMTKINLWAAFLELDLYEDIFSPSLSGTITIVDGFNLISNLPILGDELLELEYDSPTLNSPVIKTFCITKVDSKDTGGDKKLVYVLHFISQEAVLDLRSRVSKAFYGNASDVVKQIYNSLLKMSEPLDADIADNNIKFVSPFWSPIKCINFAASRCLYPNSKMNTPNYLFYQTTKGFKLKSLSTLFEQNPISELYFDKNPNRYKLPDGSTTRDIEREYRTIKELRFVSSQDYIDNVMTGTLSHKVYTVDLLRKRFNSKTYNIQTDFSKSKHMEQYPIVSPKMDLSGIESIEHKVTFPQLFDGVDDVSDSILTNRIPLLGQLDLFKLEIIIPGRTDLECGMVVDIKMQTYTETDQTDKTDAGFDKFYSGKYLITSIQHRISQTEHLCTLQVSKESSANQLVK
jgi:hypothetical protein